MMGLLGKIFGNARKPEGFLGRVMVAGMNGGSHAAMAEWGLGKIDVPQTGEILDIGCGGGANIARLLTLGKAARVTGLDYSPVSVGKSAKVNAEAIAKGRCEVVEGNVAALPFDGDRFALVTAFETVYFWPDIGKCFSAVRRILSEGGTFLIVNEDDGLSGKGGKWERIIDGMHTYTPDELVTHLTAAGFREVTVHRDEARHYLAATAIK